MTTEFMNSQVFYITVMAFIEVHGVGVTDCDVCVLMILTIHAMTVFISGSGKSLNTYAIRIRPGARNGI